MPFNSCVPKLVDSNSSATIERTPALMTTSPGRANDCSRAAMLGVSPTTSASSTRSPWPISPTKTVPAWIPTRADNELGAAPSASTWSAMSSLTPAVISRLARTAWVAESSSALG